MENYIAKAKAIIESVKGKKQTNEERRMMAIDLAALLLNEARSVQTLADKHQQAEIARMMNDPKGKAFTTSVTDQCFRSKNLDRAADQLVYLLRKFGIPKFFSKGKRLKLALFRLLGKSQPKIFVPLARRIIRQETKAVILPAEPEQLAKHLEQRRKQGVRMNLNHIGEAILGEEEALERLKTYLNDLARPEVEYISVKISTIGSQLNLLSTERTLQVLSERYRSLLRAAKENTYLRPDGTKSQKFVNLDMEEYRDLHLTVELFQKVLSEPEFQHQSAGIVLQSYLPDSYLIQQELTHWAMQRVAAGGAPIKIRIVKGANLAMEQVEASLRHWPQAPYTSKIEVDANFKRMVVYGCELDHAKAIHLGIGSHNLFDIAYVLLLRAENDAGPYVGFEMLEGMADPLRRVVQEAAGDMLLYCPVATEEEFQYAVAYLVRRLDENTASENFLRHAFGMVPGSKEWQAQATQFTLSCELMEKLDSTVRRRQNRDLDPMQPGTSDAFENEPDTDWTLPHNCVWAREILKEWSERKMPLIPLVIDGKEISAGKEEIGEDPSNPGKPFYKYIAGEAKHIDELLKASEKAHFTWSNEKTEKRSALLAEVARRLRINRGELIGAMAADGGKAIPEADAEVSEAIDFAEYYRRNLEEVVCLQDIEWKSKGAVLVATPWNFPCSIPAGGIIAALAAGNSVIFKPAPETVLTGWALVQNFWEAGIGKDVLQFFPCPDEPVGSLLIKDPRVSAIALTGSTSTAKLFMQMRPSLDLTAETGGKNAMIVTALADRDMAVKDIIHSAFGHAGQKCSACSLVICEAEIYGDPEFRKALRNAASSLPVGSQWDPYNRVNPLIKAPSSILLRALTNLEEGEEWLLEPRQDKKNPNLWSPGIKLGVKAGSFTHQNELFGPVLGIMKADDLEHAIKLANGTPYGLTSGLHSLDEREHQYWIDKIEAGNLYINRGTTGAIVQRQPFGGCKQSSFGRGAKAGGPNYVMQMMTASQETLPAEKDNISEAVHALTAFVEKTIQDTAKISLWNASIGNYAFYWNHYFQKKHDPSLLLGQDNFLYYKPHTQLTLRVQAKDNILDVMRAVAAAWTCGAALEVSGDADKLKDLLNANIAIVQETEEQLAQRIKQGKISRLRFLSMPGEHLLKAAAEAGCNRDIAPVLANGRVELLYYLREIALSVDYHRYGNLGTREGEKRKPLPSVESKKEPKSPSKACGPRCCCV